MIDFKQILTLAFEEDSPKGDITSESIIDKSAQAQGVLYCKQDLVLAGIDYAQKTFQFCDADIECDILQQDGSQCAYGTRLMHVKGNALSILKAERIALNILQRMCAIATKTRDYVDAASKSNTKILDTRKTTPIFRDLEKYAVKVGGGVNHRINLSDQMMIKDNHLEVMNYDFDTILKQAKKKHPNTFLVLEVASLEHVQQAMLSHRYIDRLMLDNMDNDMIKEAQQIINGKVDIEISGGVTLERIASLCALNVDYISVGALTHSVKAADISLEFNWL